MSETKRYYPRNTTRRRNTMYDAVREWYLDPSGRVELTGPQEVYRQRLSAAHALLTNYHTITQAVPIHAKQFDITTKTAYADLRDAIQLFGNVMKSDKEGMRYILYEYAIKTYQLAAKNGDYKAMSSALAIAMKLMGLDRDEPDMPDFSKLAGHTYEIVIPPEVEERVTSMLSGGVLDLSKMPETFQEAEIIDHEPEKESGTQSGD